MRVRRKASRQRPRSITLNLASMIDVTFLLLLYFLVTTVLAKPEDRLSPSLQTIADSATGPSADFQPQVVEVLRIEGVPVFRIGNEILRDRSELRAALERLYKPVGVFISPSDEAPVRFVASAIQTARDAGFKQVTYVAAK